MFKPELFVSFPGKIVPAWTGIRIMDNPGNPEKIMDHDIECEPPIARSGRATLSSRASEQLVLNISES
jgi:hypothetical protein